MVELVPVEGLQRPAGTSSVDLPVPLLALSFDAARHQQIEEHPTRPYIRFFTVAQLFAFGSHEATLH